MPDFIDRVFFNGKAKTPVKKVERIPQQIVSHVGSGGFERRHVKNANGHDKNDIHSLENNSCNSGARTLT